MQRYLANRLLQGLVSLFLVATLVFILNRLTGNPLDLFLPIDAPIEVRERMSEELGLNRSYTVQYLYFIFNIFRGRFGESIRYPGESASRIFWEHLPNSLSLISISFAFALILGIPLGVFAAVNRGKYIDKICSVLAVIGMATPAFWLGLMLIFVFAVVLKVLPAARMGGPSHYILPSLTLGFFLLAGIMRLIRSSMLEALGSEYVKLARIKGIPENKVLFHHCLRNSLTSMLSLAGMYFAILIGGSIVVETVFAWPGTGRLLYSAIMFRDYPLVQTIIILKAVLILIVNLIIDVSYAYIDPRIRY